MLLDVRTWRAEIQSWGSAHEKMLDVVSGQGNANTDHGEISPPTRWDGHGRSVGDGVKKWNPQTLP